MKSKEPGSDSAPVDALQRDSDEPEADLLEMVIKELFNSRTDKERADAFRAAFQLCEQEPHDEVNDGGAISNSESAAGI